MKVLYVAEGRTSEYQGDMLFHGLRSLLGPDCVDANHMWQMYKSSFGEGKRSLSECWGRGFSLYGLLPDEEIDRTDLRNKIVSRYFDIVVYSLIYSDASYLSDILNAYPANRIAFIDGGDSTDLRPERGHGVYFKRELDRNDSDLIPIQFGIPKEKIRPIDLSIKTSLISMHKPWESGYTYDRESDYYDGYAKSYFGFTKKKGGWDCMRHYEIMAAGCIPYFVDLESCPRKTLTLFPKEEMIRSRSIHNDWPKHKDEYYTAILQGIMYRLQTELTTEAMAKRVLDYMESVK